MVVAGVSVSQHVVDQIILITCLTLSPPSSPHRHLCRKRFIDVWGPQLTSCQHRVQPLTGTVAAVFGLLLASSQQHHPGVTTFSVIPSIFCIIVFGVY